MQEWATSRGGGDTDSRLEVSAGQGKVGRVS